MARPVGQFDDNKEKCYKLILYFHGMGSECFASDEYFGNKIGCGPKQVQRYLKALQDEGRIRIDTSPARKMEGVGFARKRSIVLASPKLSQELEDRMSMLVTTLQEEIWTQTESELMSSALKITLEQGVVVSDPSPYLDTDVQTQIQKTLASLSEKERLGAEADSYYAELLRNLEAEVASKQE
jgi:hypothetical protein